MIDPISTDAILKHAEAIGAEGIKLKSESGLENAANSTEFKDVLSKLIGEVDQAQKVADDSLKKIATGESKNIQDVVLKMQQADLSFQLMLKIRDKLLDAYKQVMSGG